MNPRRAARLERTIVAAILLATLIALGLMFGAAGRSWNESAPTTTQQ